MLFLDYLKRFLGIGRLPVLCCCEPANEVGYARAHAAAIPRQWEDAAGNAGLAFASEDLPPGEFTRKTTTRGTKTWKDRKGGRGGRKGGRGGKRR